MTERPVNDDTQGIRSGWNEIPEALKVKYGSALGATDLIYRTGHEQELVERIHKRTGRPIDEIRRDLEEAQRGRQAAEPELRE